MPTTRQGVAVSEADEAEHRRLCDALWAAMPAGYKDRAEMRAGRVYFCDGVRAAVVALREESDAQR